MANVLGLDLSLRATGVAYTDGTTEVLTPKVTGIERLAWYWQWIDKRAQRKQVDLVAVEGYAYGRSNGGERLGELGGIVRIALYDHRIPVVEVSPPTLKKYATGNGGAAKEMVLASAIRRLGYDGASTDCADALWLRAIGLHLLGEPVVDLPQAHLVALQKLSLPEGVAP